MPSCRPALLTPVIELVMEINPKSILDVGVGFGKWGVLFREYLEVWQGRVRQRDWLTRIIGIEPSAGYYNSMQPEVYTGIYHETVEQYLDRGSQEAFDLVFMAEVVEHLEREAAEAALPKLWELCKKAIIVTSPVGGSPQGAVFGNEYEKHRSAWDAKDFMAIFKRGQYTVIQGRYGMFWATK